MSSSPDPREPHDIAAILRARARALAMLPSDRIDHHSVDVLEFSLAGERYALHAADVQDVQPLRDLTPLPCTPRFLRGVVNIRGELIGVIDLKRFFELPEQGITDLHRVVLLRDGELQIGLLADTVEGVRPLDTRAMQPSMPTLTGIREQFVRGVTPDRLVLLDAAAILGDRRIVIDENIEP